MTDYHKLTVVKLKAELKQRGLPNSGLKPALVARLTEADALSEEGATTSTNDAEAEVKDAEATAGVDVEGEVNGTDGHSGAITDGEDSGTEERIETTPGTQAASGLQDQPKESSYNNDNSMKSPLEVSQLPSAQEDDTAPEVSEVSETVVHTAEEAQSAVPEVTKVSEVVVSGAEAVQDATPISQVSVEPARLSGDKTPDPEMAVSQEASIEAEPPISSTQTSYSKEVVEDTRKRKRRSQTPPPSSIDGAFKKAKALDGSPRVVLPEDVESKTTPTDSAMADAAPGTRKAELEPESEATKIGKATLLDEGKATLPDEEPIATPRKEDTTPMIEDYIGENENKTSPRPIEQPPTGFPMHSIASPTKTSPTDTRFKNLFSAPAKHSSPPRQEAYSDTEDRIISPAIHSATSALYIRNFMRPLQAGQLKDYLVALAKPTNASPTEEPISDFFLDAIRTHCLVRFSNVSAASRVRSALHDRVWPDERTRKPLWVDFVPEEKLKKWIDVEQSAASSRGQPAKRWEVVYEKEGGNIVAYLQETDGGNGALRGGISTAAREEAGRGVQGAPSGPRGSDARPQTRPAPKVDAGRGFKALDDLFKGTAAKPKLYWLPASKLVVDRRLDRLAVGRGGGRSDEMRRYTFEEEVLVDRGPEFGYGRGGHRGRGGGGGYSGGSADRGGGYRGDSWRGRR